jgi:hypothetical protein
VVLYWLAKSRMTVRFCLLAQTKINMFYKDINKKEIPKDIRQIYEYKVKPIKGQLVIVNHEVVKLVDLIRDDEVDGEWCYRLLHFPSKTPPQVTDISIICVRIIPLKGVISKKDYKQMMHAWEINEPYHPYAKNYFKEM